MFKSNTRPNWIKWAGTATFVLIVIGLLVVPSNRRLFAEPADVNLAPEGVTPQFVLQHPSSRTNFGVGETVTVNVVAQDMSNLAAQEFDVQVSRPDLVEILGATPGPFLATSGRSVPRGIDVDPLTPIKDAGAGTIKFGDFTWSTTDPLMPGASGSGVVASVEVKILARDGDFTNVDFDLANAIAVMPDAQTFPFQLVGKTFTLSQFGDVPPGFWAFDAVQSIYDAGITTGCGAGQYCPSWKVARDQMALFLIRALGENPVDPPTGVFGDVPPYHWAAGHIERLAELGITSGCGGGNYCPDWQVARDQMAIFLVRALGEDPVDPPTGQFADVPANHWAAGHIERLAELGVTTGCGGGNYCPDWRVARDQMAVFIQRAFNLP